MQIPDFPPPPPPSPEAEALRREVREFLVEQMRQQNFAHKGYDATCGVGLQHVEHRALPVRSGVGALD